MRELPIDEKALEETKQIALHILEPLSSVFEQNQIALRKKEAIIKAIDNYIKACVKARLKEESFKKRLEKKNKHYTPENLGTYLFTRRVGRKPMGKVSAERVEGIFIISCSTPADYAAIHAAEYTGKNQHTTSIGTYGKEFFLRDNDEKINFILIRSTPDTVKEHQNIKEHERQHFLNDSMFNEFTDAELTFAHDPVHYPTLYQNSSSKKERKSLLENLVFIKDELLARLRGDIYDDYDYYTDMITDEDYSDSLKNTTKNEKEDLKNLMEHISWELEKVMPIFVTRNDRALLVYQLIDIPLIRFPEWLRAIGEYYSKQK